MWKVINIHATNLCAFKTLDYNVPQNHTTLIFGNNMDNDSQGSNGSGKSAMLEALAIGLTGETLRKIKMEEIINDAEDEAAVEIQLDNTSLNQYMTIHRTLTRKSPQEISITVRHNDMVESVEEATVADYNKYILEAIGLTKDDVFSNFILSKHKYTPFLSSSDREKKEIINRFSNGNLVDESIVALQEDIQPIEETLRTAENQVATCRGRIEAVTEQIDEAVASQQECSLRNAERIENWKRAIADKRAYQREQRESINEIDTNLDELDGLDKNLQELENSNQNISQVYKAITEAFEKHNLNVPKDYTEIVEDYRLKLEDTQKQFDSYSAEYASLQKLLNKVQATYDKVSQKRATIQESSDSKISKLNDKYRKYGEKYQALQQQYANLTRESRNLSQQISKLQTLLAGTIVCPKCQHEFILGKDVDVQNTKQKIIEIKAESTDVDHEIQKNCVQSDECFTAKSQINDNICVVKQELDDWYKKEEAALSDVSYVKEDIEAIKEKLAEYNRSVQQLQQSIDNSRSDLFDEAFETIDKAYKNLESKQSQAELNIKTAEGSINSYEEMIKEAESYLGDDVVESLQKNKAKYEKELETALAAKEEIEQKLNKFKQQEATFVEFKTHLANSKIDALSQITNEFLEEIGSDIRIVFSGYTKLKSGKIRDKISISLIRDGIDCGSFDKFSEGEKARVNLANILAMHKLTNITCDDGKGLELLVLDEILEATDEQGLTNIFNALNQLQITALVVSHGNIAENYPYKTVVCKQNGISFINGQEKL